MNILIAIGGKEYSKPTLDLGMKVANALANAEIDTSMKVNKNLVN